uniref:Uncharacterized protein n=1 Tax=Anguilla anguilla TaxID=7936 RepID=A0A0E9U217_ANGAN
MFSEESSIPKNTSSRFSSATVHTYASRCYFSSL